MQKHRVSSTWHLLRTVENTKIVYRVGGTHRLAGDKSQHLQLARELCLLLILSSIQPFPLPISILASILPLSPTVSPLCSYKRIARIRISAGVELFPGDREGVTSCLPKRLAKKFPRVDVITRGKTNKEGPGNGPGWLLKITVRTLAPLHSGDKRGFRSSVRLRLPC